MPWHWRPCQYRLHSFPELEATGLNVRLHLSPDAEMGRFPSLASNSSALIIVFDSAIVNTSHINFSMLSAQDEEREDFSVVLLLGN
jgi:hypothetical protein